MSPEFLDAWGLFGASYVAALVASILLAMAGSIMLAKDTLLESLAATQAALLGSLVALVTGWHPAWLLSTLAAIMALVAGSAPAAFGRQRASGWIFVAASGLSAVIVAGSSHGSDELGSLTTSGLIGATWTEAIGLGFMALVVASALACCHRRLFLILCDPESALAAGLGVTIAGAWIATAQGAALGLSMEATGCLFTASALLMPPMAASLVCRTSTGVLWLSPLFGLSSTFLSLVVAHQMDLPHAAVTASIMSMVVALAWVWRRLSGCSRPRVGVPSGP